MGNHLVDVFVEEEVREEIDDDPCRERHHKAPKDALEDLICCGSFGRVPAGGKVEKARIGKEGHTNRNSDTKEPVDDGISKLYDVPEITVRAGAWNKTAGTRSSCRYNRERGDETEKKEPCGRGDEYRTNRFHWTNCSPESPQTNTLSGQPWDAIASGPDRDIGPIERGFGVFGLPLRLRARSWNGKQYHR